VLRSGWWTYGPVGRQLEEEYAAFIGVPHAIAVSSGTAALHLAFAALGLKSGEQVLMPALNFVAAANCAVHLGALPKFVDVSSCHYPLTTVEILESAITPKTRGICILHYGGFPCEMDAISRLAAERGLWLVEDAAHAPGSRWQNKACGAWGNVGCFSFFGNKNLTCGEGGMITTSDAALAQKLRTIRSHGMSLLTWDRHQGHQASYDVSEAGYNYRMDDLRAAILGVQLASLPEANRRRAERRKWYVSRLSGKQHWIIPFEDSGNESSHHLFTIVLDRRLERVHIMSALKLKGIQTSVHYPPIHTFSFYRSLVPEQPELPVTEDLGRRIMTLPLYPDMTREQVDWVCECLFQAVADVESSQGLQATV
jgi:dTDP-4-amino-4,6-dideoxygalactose transaminase